MSRRRVYSPSTLAVMERFFTALERCIADGRVKNLYRYCMDNGIGHRHFYNQRADMNRGYFEISWAIPLVLAHGVSADWLLTGHGQMYVNPAD
ncbi:MAG: helix-turn-helix domain containing protein [Bacteroidales bacterium]|nr:helix-turn-helix domain containing protein [Bacteroidales bacterium]